MQLEFRLLWDLSPGHFASHAVKLLLHTSMETHPPSPLKHCRPPVWWVWLMISKMDLYKVISQISGSATQPPTKHNAPAFHSQHQRTPGQKWRCGIHSQGLARRRSQRCCCLNDTSFPMFLNDLDLIYRTITFNTHLQVLPANWSYKIMLWK